jgi:hypothetical protein
MIEAARSHQFRHLRTGHQGNAALPRDRGKNFLSKRQCMAKHRLVVNKKAVPDGAGSSRRAWIPSQENLA